VRWSVNPTWLNRVVAVLDEPDSAFVLVTS
jgi:hypothetical protein